MITAFNFHHLEHSILVGRDWDLFGYRKLQEWPPAPLPPNVLTEFGVLVQEKCASVAGDERQECGNDLLDSFRS